jgi:peptide/nickel transport system permease protein
MGGRAWVAYVVRKVALMFLTLFIASIVIFGSLALSPGDPAASLAGGSMPNPQNLAAIRAEFHLDDPIWIQYGHWLGGVLSGDMGRSMVFRTDMSTLLSGRLVTTALLVTYAGLLIIVLGIGLGLVAALRGRRARTAVTVATTVAMGAPTFVVAIGLIALFSSGLNWFPVFGAGSGLIDRLWHLTLPAIALACSYVAYVATVTRAAIQEELVSEHVETARSRGIAEHLIVRRHVLRNASAPILTVSGLSIAGLFAGTAVAEQAFGISGVGSLLVEAAAKKDLAVVQIISLFMVAAFVVINTVVDTINFALDSRVALEVDAR